MSAILTAKGLAAGHADRLLFSGLDLVITPGEITGLVGANGAGKSTLLRILAGLAQPDQGEVGLSPPAATVGYLSQEPERRPGESINGFIARRTGVARALQDLDEATALLVEEKPGADDAYATALERWLALGGADLEERAAEVFTTLGLPADVGREAMTSLSGGQAARVNLASLLLSRYDVFLLTSPPTIWTSPGWRSWKGSCGACGPEPSWSATTARFSSVPCIGSWNSTWRSSRYASTAAVISPTWRSGRSPDITPARPTRSTPIPGLGSRNGCEPRSAGPTRASVKPGPRRPTTTSTSCTGRSPVRKAGGQG